MLVSFDSPTFIGIFNLRLGGFSSCKQPHWALVGWQDMRTMLKKEERYKTLCLHSELSTHQDQHYLRFCHIRFF